MQEKKYLEEGETLRGCFILQPPESACMGQSSQTSSGEVWAEGSGKEMTQNEALNRDGTIPARRKCSENTRKQCRRRITRNSFCSLNSESADTEFSDPAKISAGFIRLTAMCLLMESGKSRRKDLFFILK